MKGWRERRDGVRDKGKEGATEAAVHGYVCRQADVY